VKERYNGLKWQGGGGQKQCDGNYCGGERKGGGKKDMRKKRGGTAVNIQSRRMRKEKGRTCRTEMFQEQKWEIHQHQVVCGSEKIEERGKESRRNARTERKPEKKKIHTERRKDRGARQK